ncbi:tetratricopeptide repeat protein [Rhizobium sp.]
MTSTIKTSILAFAATLSLAYAGAALAAGSEDDAKPECKEGQVYDEATKSCVDKTGQLNDDTIYRAARDYAYAGKYGEALGMLKRAANQNDPRILTYYGYTNRKLGNIDVAMDYYNRAIAADGNNLLARSYMGQGLVQEGKIEEARVQLIEIRDRGGKGTYAYDALYQALKTGSTY